MRLGDLHYHLPPDRIARWPAPERTAARLLSLDRQSGDVADAGTVSSLVERVRPGDVWVLNDTRVRRARLVTHKLTGGRVELLILSVRGNEAEALYGASKPLRPGAQLRLCSADGAPRAHLEVVANLGNGHVALRFSEDAEALIAEVGEIPLPPYLDRPADAADTDRYQTVYARELGAVAAPTAGLHFTPELMAAMEARGARFATITLHVGPGTFRPIRTERVEDHEMHAEPVVIPEATARLVNEATRVVAVGTTAVRALEAAGGDSGRVRAWSGPTDLFITPGYSFRAVDALLTNFHLPGSSLIALVGAFAGLDAVLGAYREAVDRGYRFYSYGDAMWIS